MQTIDQSTKTSKRMQWPTSLSSNRFMGFDKNSGMQPKYKRYSPWLLPPSWKKKKKKKKKSWISFRWNGFGGKHSLTQKWACPSAQQSDWLSILNLWYLLYPTHRLLVVWTKVVTWLVTSGNSGPKQILKKSDCDPLLLCPSVTGRPCGWVAQSVVRVLAQSPRGSAICFFLPWNLVCLCSGCNQQRDCLVGSGVDLSRYGDKSN